MADDGGGWARFEDPQGVGFGLWRENNRYARDHENVTPARGEVGYLTIGAPDGPRARVFYQELLGWQFRPAQPNDYHHVDNTELPLGVLGGGTGPEVKLYLRIDDLDGLTARVTELGGGITSEDESPSGRTAECVDDQGAPFCLWEPAAGY